MEEVRYIAIGDVVSLFSEETNGFVCSFESSSAYNTLYSMHNQTRMAINNTPNVQGIRFQIFTENRYKLSKRYRKMLSKFHTDTVKYADRTATAPSNEELASMKEAAAAEEFDNNQEQLRCHGKPLRFGDVVQFKHQFSDKWVHVSTVDASRIDKSYVLLTLQDHNVKAAQFRILPRYKVKEHGDLVGLSDEIILESIKSPGHFWHLSKPIFGGAISVEGKVSELNLGSNYSGLIIMKCSRSRKKPDHQVHWGEFVQFFHRDLEAFMSADGRASADDSPNVYLREQSGHAYGQTGITNYAGTFWQLEEQSSCVPGEEVATRKHMRIRNVTSQRYLTVNPETRVVYETSNRDDPMTVFQIHPQNKQQEKILDGENVAIENLQTKTWLHAGNLCADDAHAETENRLIEMLVSDVRQYNDTLTICTVSVEHMRDSNFIAGMCSVMQRFMADRISKQPITVENGERLQVSFNEIRSFLLNCDEGVRRYRQQLLRSFKMIDLLIRILQLGENQHINGYSEMLDEAMLIVLFNYVKKTSLKNVQYLCKYMDYLQRRILTGQQSMNTLRIVVEMVRDRPVIINSFTREQITSYINFLLDTQEMGCLDLLGALCCSGSVTFPQNQIQVTQMWLTHPTLSAIYRFDMRVENGEELVYIGRYEDGSHELNWVKIRLFTKRGSKFYNEKNYVSVLRQLELFNSLCAGGNTHCIDIVTRYLPASITLQCICNINLPYELRIRFCALVANSYLKTDATQMSVLDWMHNAFDYNKITPDQPTFALSHAGTRKSRSHSYANLQLTEPVKQAPQLVNGFNVTYFKNWLIQYLPTKATLYADNPSGNRFLAEVLKLADKLLQLKCFSLHDANDLIAPVVSILDGTTDLPFQHARQMTEKQNEMVMRYRFIGRYESSDGHIAEVKAAGVSFLETLLTLTCREHLVQYLSRFKFFDVIDDVYLHKLLSVTDSLDDSERQSIIESMYGIHPSIKMNLQTVTSVLHDLANYKNPTLLEKSTVLLQRLYCTVEAHIASCRDAFLFISDRSTELNRELDSMIPLLNIYSLKTSSDQLCESVVCMLDKLSECCYHYKAPHMIPNHQNQTIIVKRNVLRIVVSWFSNEQGLMTYTGRPAAVDVVRSSLHLIQAIATGNPELQQLAFESVDILLQLRHDAPTLANTLLRIFQDNLQIGVMIQPSLIDKIVPLVYSVRDPVTLAGIPEVLLLLRNIVTLEKSGLSFKRSQKMVIKRLTESYKLVFGILELPEKQKERILAGHCGRNALEYFVNLVELLACCVENESLSIETLCHTLLPFREILHYLAGPYLTAEARSAMYHYFSATFLNKTRKSDQVTKRGEKLMNEILMQPDFWEMLNQFSNDFRILDEAFESVSISVLHEFTISNYCGTYEHVHRCTICNWLVHKAEKRMEPERVQKAHEIFHLALNGMVLFLGSFMTAFRVDPESRHVVLITEEQMRQIDVLRRRIEPRLRALSVRCALVKHRRRITTTIEAMNRFNPALNNVFGSSEPIMLFTSFVDNNEDRLTEVFEKAAQEIDDTYENERIINKKFQQFVDVCEKLYQGENTVAAQLQHRKPDNYGSNEYSTEMNPMPLGPQFQQYVRCYIDDAREKDRKEIKLKRLRNVINYLILIAEKRAKHGREAKFSDSFNICRCLQLLRAFIHNHVRLLPDDWEELEDSKTVECQLDELELVQNALARFKVFNGILPHLADADVQHDVLRLISMLLFNTNTFLQSEMHQYFVLSCDETFFREMHKLLENGGSELKKRRYLKHQLKIHNGEKLESNTDREKVPNNMLAAKVPEVTTQNGHVANEVDKQHVYLEMQQAKLNGQAIREAEETNAEPPSFSESSTNAYEKHTIEGIRLALEVAALLCDGQNRELQDSLRAQPEHAVSYNLVADIINFLRILSKQIDRSSIEEISAVCDALNEICCGNQFTREELHHNKMIEYVNHLLSESSYTGCSFSDVLEMQSCLGQLVMSLIEENGPEASVTAARLKDTVDLFAIVRIITECYRFEKLATKNRQVMKDRFPSMSDNEIDSLVVEHVEVGRIFAVILTRLEDIDPSIEGRIPTDDETVTAIKRFQHQLMSIEVVKNDVLQKVNFHVSERRLLRESVKEEVKWHIERDSHATKTRDLLEWASAVIKDMQYFRRLLRFPPVLWLMVAWRYINIVATLEAFAINIYMIVFTVATSGNYLSLIEDYSSNPLPQEIDLPTSITINDNPTAILALSVVHNVLAGVIMISFFILANPALPSFEWFEHLNFKKKEEEEEVEEVGESEQMGATSPHLAKRETERSVQTSLLSASTLYYLAYFAMSICGTALNQLFFVFHLFHIVAISSSVQRIMKAITKNGWNLFWVLTFVLLVIYYFGVAAVLWFRSTMNPVGDPPNELYCETFLQCVISVGWNGLDAAIYANQKPFPPSLFSRAAGIAVFQVCFIITINIILLSAVLIGIVVDTFAELREERSEAEKDMREKCFICDIKSHDFEHHGLGFRYHTRNEHNMWAYIYYFYYLETTAPEDYSAIDLYVSRCIQKKNYDFLPFEQALSLVSEKEEDIEMKAEQIESKVSRLLNIQTDLHKRRLQQEDVAKRRKWLAQVSRRSNVPSERRERSETNSTGSGEPLTSLKSVHA